MRQWERKKAELASCVQHAQPLFQALAAYRGDHGEYPRSLMELTPRYINAVMDPPFPFDSEWQYSVRGHDNAYALYVWVPPDYCSVAKGLMRFSDRFVYHSDGRYEKYAYGGVLERIGDWAYYHE